MILEKLHRAINNFNKTFNWRRFRRDALHLGESLLVFGVLYGIFSTLIWGVCWLFKINYNPDLIAVAWAVPVLLDTLVKKAYDLYIGTKTAIFPLTGFPKAQNESELATLLGISKKEWEDIEFDNDCPDDLHYIEGMDLDDTADGEMDCVTGRIGIRYCGCELVPMIEPVSGTVGFVDAKQIMPVADEIRKSRYFKYCARKMASGGRYYVIKDGMVVRGAVLPVKLEPLAKSGLRELADMVKKTRDVADVEDLSEQEDKNDA